MGDIESLLENPCECGIEPPGFRKLVGGGGRRGWWEAVGVTLGILFYKGKGRLF